MPEMVNSCRVGGAKYRSQVKGHKSKVSVLPIQNQPLPLTNANIRPKNCCFGLIRPKISYNECLGFLPVLVKQLPVTCDL